MATEANRLLRLLLVIDLTGLSRSSIYALERAGQFPSRVAIGPRSVAWRENEIAAWIEARQRRVAA